MGQSQTLILNLPVAYSTSTPSRKLSTSESALSFPKPTILPPSTGNEKEARPLTKSPHTYSAFSEFTNAFTALSRLSNPNADALSRDFHLSESQSLTFITKILPQTNSYQVWTLSPKVISSVITALLRQPSYPESLLVVPKAPKQHGNNGKKSSLKWPLTPFSKPSKTKYRSYKSFLSEFVPANLQPTAIPSRLDRLEITYGSLANTSGKTDF